MLFHFKEFRNRLRIASCQHEKCDICLCRRRYLALLGYLTVIYLAALRQTPTDQVEAARIDGCNGWQLFRYIYLPNIKSTVNLMFVMIVIGSFLAFDYVKLLTGGGPAHSTEVLGTYAYSFAFSEMKVGKGGRGWSLYEFLWVDCFSDLYANEPQRKHGLGGEYGSFFEKKKEYGSMC